jgi:hypothetical protein
MKQAELGDDELRAEIKRLEGLIGAGISKEQSPLDIQSLRHTLRSFRNRLAAKKSRISKRMSFKDMERRVQTLEQENCWLRLQLSSSDMSSASTMQSFSNRSASAGSSSTGSSRVDSDFCSDEEYHPRISPARSTPCPVEGSA